MCTSPADADDTQLRSPRPGRTLRATVLATLPPDPAVVDGERQCLRTDVDYCDSYWPGSQGGHSTLILDSTCWSPGLTATSWCELTLAPDDNPTASRRVGGFVPIDRSTGDAERQSNVAGDNLDDVYPVLTPPVVAVGANAAPGDAVAFDPATRQVQGVERALEQGTGPFIWMR